MMADHGVITREEVVGRLGCAQPTRVGGFPTGPIWRITEERAQEWARMCDIWREGPIRFLAGSSDLAADELGALFLDISCWQGMHRRGTARESLAEYLRHGREDWGSAGNCELLDEQDAVDPDAPDALVPLHLHRLYTEVR